MELKGLKAAFLGDSITEGVGASAPNKVYHAVLKDECGLSEVLNYGISGTRIARQNQTVDNNTAWDENFISRVDSMRCDVDLIVVFGGTNDYGHGDAPLGSFCDRTDGTFYGAMHILLEKLIRKYPTKTIVFMTPLHREGDLDPKTVRVVKGYFLSEYVNAIKEVCAYYSVPVLDLYACAGMNPCIEEQKAYYFSDGTHPNDNGYRRIAERLCGFLRSL